MAGLTESDFTTNNWVGCGGLHMVPLCQTIIEGLLPLRQLRLLDMGCGCGAIGIALLAQGTISELVMTDVDATSVDFAAQNVQRLLSPEKQAVTRTYVADVWQVTTEPLPELPFDVIACNAPLSEQLPQDDKVNPYRFFNEGWKFQRNIFSGLNEYLKPGGIVIIKDLVGAGWWLEFNISCIATVIGDQSTLQKSSRFFTAQGETILPYAPSTVRVGTSWHCLRVFQRAV